MTDSGVVLLDKAAGITSAKAIAQVKHRLGIKKIGHAGTLDPMATGLLVCLVNRATKLAQTVQGGKKRYTGTIRLGETTSTDDVEGETLALSDDIPSFDQVAHSARAFVGELSQVPPAVSAVKVQGVRAYALVRDHGITPELKARQVTVSRFDVAPASEREVAFVIECSSGTYVRSLARDLGRSLGCGACLASLRREMSFPFSVAHAKGVDLLSSSDLVPIEDFIGMFSKEDLCRLSS